MLFKEEKQGIFLINLFVINKLHQPRQKITENKRFEEISLEKFARRRIGITCWLNNLAVDINGDIIPCIKAKMFVLGNIRKTPINKIIYSNNINKYWYSKKDTIETCSQCEFRYACDDCRLNAFYFTSKLDAKYPFCAYNPLRGQWNIALPEINDKRRGE